MQNCSLLISCREKRSQTGLTCKRVLSTHLSLLVSQDMARAPQRPPSGPLPPPQALALAGPKVGLALPVCLLRLCMRLPCK